MRVVSSFEATGLDERGWNALARLGTNSVFQTYQWHRSWWHTYGSRYEPLFVTVSNGHNIKGVAPLYVEETAAGRVVRFVGRWPGGLLRSACRRRREHGRRDG